MTLPPPRVILYLEDNERLCQTVRDVLEFAGWHVKPSTDSILSWATLDCTNEHFDLLLLDHEVRGINGLELTRRVRGMSHRKGTPNHSHLALRPCRGSARGGRGCVPAQAE